MSNADIDRLASATAFDTEGQKLGSVGQVYLDDQTERPSWVSVSTGLFGTNETLVPLEGHRWDGDKLVVAYSKDVVKDAPNIDADAHISEQEEQELYRYYEGHGYATTDRRDAVTNDRRDDVAGVAGTAGVAGVTGRDRRDDVADRDFADRDVTDRDRRNDDTTSMTRSEERLNVGTETVETGSARLRKYTTTETETVSVPVTKEKLVVERTAVDGRPSKGGKIGEGDDVEEITLREERPVVSKETVDVEEVRVGKETVTEQQQVTDEVRKEHIEVEGEGDANKRRR